MNSEKTLDEKEIILLNTLKHLFQDRYAGKDKAVKTDSLIFHLKATGFGVVHPQSIRKVIGYIRQNDILSPAFILSNVHIGYWLSSDKDEQNLFIDQELNRMSNQFTNIRLLHQRIRHGKKKENNQPQLF